MSDEVRISGRLITAARGLAGIGQADFAKISGMPLDTLRGIEAGGSAWVRSPQDAALLHRALEHFGVIIIVESDGLGAGVRLKFTREDVSQVTRLEDEGGVVGADDAP